METGPYAPVPPTWIQAGMLPTRYDRPAWRPSFPIEQKARVVLVAPFENEMPRRQGFSGGAPALN